MNKQSFLNHLRKIYLFIKSIFIFYLSPSIKKDLLYPIFWTLNFTDSFAEMTAGRSSFSP